MESQITEENFDKMIEQHNSMEEQKLEREAYCEENDCPEFWNFERGEVSENKRMHRGTMGNFEGVKGECPFAEASE